MLILQQQFDIIKFYPHKLIPVFIVFKFVSTEQLKEIEECGSSYFLRNSLRVISRF